MLTGAAKYADRRRDMLTGAGQDNQVIRRLWCCEIGESPRATLESSSCSGALIWQNQSPFRSRLMGFVALDFETANPSLASICQIGVVEFDNNSHTEIWQTLVNPEDYFDPMNVYIHGINEDDVQDVPTFPQIYDKLRGYLAGRIVAHHTGFDKTAFVRASEKHGLRGVECNWLDTAKVVRRTWPEVAYRGYGLLPVARMLGIEFRHHAADEDARAAGEILIRAIRHSGMPLTDWLARVKKPINITSDGRVTHQRTGNPEGPFAGETTVFTGALSIPRRDAADLAAQAGCDVTDGVTKATTLLVVGDQDIRKLVGHEKSAKHRKAEALIAKGQAIRILGESDFLHLIGTVEA
jgi:DNA polymerase-3 subunit epsilon